MGLPFSNLRIAQIVCAKVLIGTHCHAGLQPIKTEQSTNVFSNKGKYLSNRPTTDLAAATKTKFVQCG